MSATAAGHRLADTEITTVGNGGFTRFFVVTDHGIVSRTDVAGAWEITLLRPRCTYARYQGSIYATGTPGVWLLKGPDGQPLGTVTGDYLDAESVLIARRSERRAEDTYAWPQHMRHAISPTARREAARRAREDAKPKCRICGWALLSSGECDRPDLHWTAESIAAENRERAQRHARTMLDRARARALA